jgi:hypothetical protein
VGGDYRFESRMKLKAIDDVIGEHIARCHDIPDSHQKLDLNTGYQGVNL